MRSIISLVLLLVVSACGKPQGSDEKFVITAPRTNESAGLIVKFDSARQAENFIQSHTGKVRVLHEASQMYEVFGISSDEFKTRVGSHQFLEKNRIIQQAVPQVRSKFFFDSNMKRTAFAKSTQVENPTFDPAKCIYRPEGDLKMPIPKALLDVSDPESLRDAKYPTLKLGGTIKFDSSRTVHSTGMPRQIDIFWAVFAPSGSVYDNKYYFSKQLELTPDMPGRVDMTMIAKDSDYHCSYVIYSFSVTHAEPFQGIRMPRDFNDKRDTMMFSHLGSISAYDAWKTTEGSGAVIAILDTGVNYNHPDLSRNIFVNDKNEYGIDVINGTKMPFDDGGHGTHVAGLAASAVTGVARKARILPVKVLDGMGAGDLASILKGMLYAADQGATVLNMSLSFEKLVPQDLGDPSPTESDSFEKTADAFRATIKEVGRKGAVVVASAGNSDTNIDANPAYPASLSSESNITIAVAATGLNGELAAAPTREKNEYVEYSNFGSKAVSVAAPGGSAKDADPEKLNDNGGLMSTYYWPVRGKFGYIRYSGTSMASPVTAGVVALMKSAHSEIKNYQYKSILMKTSDRVPSLQGKVTSGGKINAAAAVAIVPEAPKNRSGWTKN